MNTIYKGYSIDVNEEKCLGGWVMIYFSVTRMSDGLIIIEDFTEEKTTLPQIIKVLKNRVDGFIESKGYSEDLKEEFNV